MADLRAGLRDQRRGQRFGHSREPATDRRVRGRRVPEDGPVTRQPAPPPGVVDLPPRTDLALMAVGLVAVSTSGPLMAAIAAPALAVAMWRNAFALVAITPVALATRLGELRGLTVRERRWALGAGVLLAGALRDLGAEPALHLGRVRDRHRVHPAGVGRADRQGVRARRAAAHLGRHHDRPGGGGRPHRRGLLARAAGAVGRPAGPARRRLRGVLHRGRWRGPPVGEHDDVHAHLLRDGGCGAARGVPRGGRRAGRLQTARPGCSCSP